VKLVSPLKTAAGCGPHESAPKSGSSELRYSIAAWLFWSGQPRMLRTKAAHFPNALRAAGCYKPPT